MKIAVLTTVVLGFFAAAQAHEAPAVTFTAGASKLTGPATVPAGYVRLVLDNQDDAMRAHGIFRVRQGASLAEAQKLVMRVFSSEDVSHEEEQTLVNGFYSGAVFIAPGRAGEVGVTLKPGRYVVYTDEITAQGPTVTPEYVTTLVVTPTDHSAADARLHRQDGGPRFCLPGEGGAHLWRVENSGHQEHMMFISKLLPGKTSGDVTALLEDETLDLTTVLEEKSIGVHGVAPGVYNDVVFDREPGEYAAVCFVSDPETGIRHALLGMTQTFTVAAAGGRQVCPTTPHQKGAT